MSDKKYYTTRTLQHGNLQVQAGVSVTERDINAGDIKRLLDRKILMTEADYLEHKKKQEVANKKVGRSNAELDKLRAELDATRAELATVQTKLTEAEAELAQAKASAKQE
jgi:chromosome segregation ATPase